MANIVGQVNLNGCNYQVGYDLLSQNVAGNYSTVRLYGILNVTNNYVAWTRGTASVGMNTPSTSAGLATRYNRGSYTVVTQDINLAHDSNGGFGGTLTGALDTTFTSGTASGRFSLPKINRIAITNSVIGSVLEENFKVNFTKYVDNFAYKLRISIPNVKELEKINYQNSGVNFKLTQATLDYLYTYTKNSNDVKLGFAVETWSGNSKISSGNEIIITGKIVNANPTFNDFAFEDTNSKTVALTGNNKSIISGYSNIKATISVDNKATSKKGATMVKYRLSVGDNSKDISYSSTAAVNGIVNKVTNSTINVYAIDSRNNSTLVSKQALKFYSYNPLEKGNISLERSDGGVGENVTLNYTGKIDLKNFGKVTNSIKTATYTLQRSDSSTITKGKTTIIPTVSSNGSFSFTGLIKGDTTAKGFDIGSSYIITVTVTDELSSITFTSNLSSGTPNIALSKNGVSVMGKYDEKLGGLLQVGGTIISTQKVLWTNPNPTDNFASQTITLNSNDYDYLWWIFYNSTEAVNVISAYSTKGLGVNIDYIINLNIGVSQPTGVRERQISYINDKQYSITNCLERASSASSTPIERQDRLILAYVIGYKTGLFN